MSETSWRDRLMQAIDADGRSDRAISIAAGLGANYVHQMRTRHTSPSLDHTERLAAALGLNPFYLLTGIELDAEGETFIRMAATLTPEQRGHLLTLLRAFAPPPSA